MHEIASGGNGRAVPQGSGAAKRLWGFGEIGVEDSAIFVGYLARIKMQLKRYGMNFAKWRFHVLSHQRFQWLKHIKSAHFTTFER